MRTRRILAAITAAVLSAAVLAGCSSSGNASDASSSEKVTLNLWAWTANSQKGRLQRPIDALRRTPQSNVRNMRRGGPARLYAAVSSDCVSSLGYWDPALPESEVINIISVTLMWFWAAVVAAVNRCAAWLHAGDEIVVLLGHSSRCVLVSSVSRCQVPRWRPRGRPARQRKGRRGSAAGDRRRGR
jgi:outer membrane murein-binding lipoprotein Lpp